MEGNFEKLEAVEPDFEITVRNGTYEIAVIGVFRVDDETYDVVIGVDDAQRRAELQTLFGLIISALPIAAFTEVRNAGNANVDNPPF